VILRREAERKRILSILDAREVECQEERGAERERGGSTEATPSRSAGSEPEVLRECARDLLRSPLRSRASSDDSVQDGIVPCRRGCERSEVHRGCAPGVLISRALSRARGRGAFARRSAARAMARPVEGPQPALLDQGGQSVDSRGPREELELELNQGQRKTSSAGLRPSKVLQEIPRAQILIEPAGSAEPRGCSWRSRASSGPRRLTISREGPETFTTASRARIFDLLGAGNSGNDDSRECRCMLVRVGGFARALCVIRLHA